VRKKNKPPQQENHERWLISYADFITLLFAFFVVMYASSQADHAKAVQVSESLRQALEDGNVSRALAKLMGEKADKSHAAKPEDRKAPEPPRPPDQPLPAASPAKSPDLQALLQELTRRLKSELEAGRMEIHLEMRGLVVSLKEQSFFPSGTDEINTESLPTLETIAKEIAPLPNSIRMEGHTDSVPIHTARFASNWDLSAARAIATLTLFRDRFHLPVERMAVAGFADTAPLASNESGKGRSRNRRVDIVVLNEMARLAGPEQKPSGATDKPVTSPPVRSSLSETAAAPTK
jgi:chemotaxis protein MotB